MKLSSLAKILFQVLAFLCLLSPKIAFADFINLPPNKLIIPYFPVGQNTEFVDDMNPPSQWINKIIIKNTTDKSNTATVQMFKLDGQLVNEQSVAIAPKASYTISSEIYNNLNQVLYAKINCQYRGCHAFVNLEKDGGNRFAVSTYNAESLTTNTDFLYGPNDSIYFPYVVNDFGYKQDDILNTKIIAYSDKDLFTSPLYIFLHDNKTGKTTVIQPSQEGHIFTFDINHLTNFNIPFPFEGSISLSPFEQGNKLVGVAIIESNKRLTTYNGIQPTRFVTSEYILPLPDYKESEPAYNQGPWVPNNIIAVQNPYNDKTVRLEFYNKWNQLIDNLTIEEEICEYCSKTYHLESISVPGSWKDPVYVKVKALDSFNPGHITNWGYMIAIDYVSTPTYHDDVLVGKMKQYSDSRNTAIFNFPTHSIAGKIINVTDPDYQSSTGNFLAANYFSLLGNFQNQEVHSSYPAIYSFYLCDACNSAEMQLIQPDTFLPHLFSYTRVLKRDSYNLINGDGYSILTPSIQCSVKGNINSQCWYVNEIDLKMLLDNLDNPEADVNDDMVVNSFDLVTTLANWSGNNPVID